VVVGSLIYRLILIIALRYGYKLGFEPGDLKLISVLLVIIALSIPLIKSRIDFLTSFSLGRKDLQNKNHPGEEV